MKYKMHIGALYDSYAPRIFTQSVVGFKVCKSLVGRKNSNTLTSYKFWSIPSLFIIVNAYFRETFI